MPSPASPNEIRDPFRRLVEIMARLRAPDGCPWDGEQTHRSLTPYLIEEAYEVKDSLDREDFGDLREELGDLTLQVVFHAQLANEEKRFDIDDVLTGICDKLIRRHPHVFGDVAVSGSGEVLKNWEDIKKAEKADKAEAANEPDDEAPSILSGVPQSLPALLKAHRIQEKVAHVGFDWTSTDPVWDKMHEEIDELREALALAARENKNADEGSASSADAPQDGAVENAHQRVGEEIGDFLFSIVNLARKLGVPAEEALDMTNRKFMARFREIERRVHADGHELSDLSLEALDAHWNAVKAQGDKPESR